MASNPFPHEVSEQVCREAQGQHLFIPPNLVWRLGIIMHHKQVSFAATRDTGRVSIIVFCEEECGSGHPIPFRDFQKFLYSMFSELPNEYTYFDHIGTFYTRNGYLLLEVQFSSEKQIANCLDGLESTSLTQKIKKCLTVFVDALRGVEINASLVVFSNLDLQPKQVMHDNISFAYRLVYAEKPSLVLYHITDPTVYAPIKAAYDQLVQRFPDFFGETGPVDIFSSDGTAEGTDIPSSDLQDVPTHKATEIYSSPEELNVISTKLLEDCTAQNSSSPSAAISSGTSTTKFQSKPAIASHSPNTACTPSSYSKQHETLDTINESRVSITLDTAEPLPDSSSISETNWEDVTDKELIVIAEMIPPEKYMAVGIHLGLSITTIKRIQADNRDSIHCIVNILDEAKKNLAGRSHIACALAQSKLAKAAQVLDPSVDLETIAPSKDLPVLGSSGHESENRVYLVDGRLHFYDKELAEDHLKKQQPLTFWAALHRQISSVVEECLRKYQIPLHSTMVGSFIAKVLFQNFHQAILLTEDIVSGCFPQVVEEKLRLLGYIHQLGVKLELCESEATPRNCYKLYLKAIGSNKTVSHAPGLLSTVTPTQPLLLPESAAETRSFSVKLGAETLVNVSPTKTEIFTSETANAEKTTKRQFSDNSGIKQASHSDRKTGQGIPILQRSVSHSTPRMKATALPSFKVETGKQFEKRFKPMRQGASTGYQIMYSDANLLSYLIRKGDLSKVQQLIEKGADLSQTDSGHMPIHIAAHYGRESIVRTIIMHGGSIDVQTTNELKLTALHIAAYYGHHNVAQALVELGANIEARTPQGYTPLRMAASEGYGEITELLLKNKANCNSQCNERDTPLHSAAALGRKGVVKVLLHYHADVTLLASDGKTPIHTAIFSKDSSILQLLLQENPDALSHPNMAISDPPPVVTACKLESPDMLKVLIKHKVDLNVIDLKDNMTPLMVACAIGNTALIDILASNGADISKTVPLVGTPLHMAVENGQANAAKQLLQLGVNPDVLDSGGVSPLMRAVECEQTEIAELLLRHEANVTLKHPETGLPILHKAAARNSVKMLKLVMAHGVDINQLTAKGTSALHIAVVHGAKDATDLLCNANCNINIQTRAGITPLLAAIKSRQFECALRILKYSPDVNICDNDQVSPLYAATEYRAIEVVTPLLKMGASMDSPAPNDVSPIQLACLRGYHEIIELMLETNPAVVKSSKMLAKPLIFLAISSASPLTLQVLLHAGVDPNTRAPGNQNTPLHEVCRQGYSTMVADLLSHGADPTLQSPVGTALHMAVGAGQYKCAKQLLTFGMNPNVVAGPEQVTPLIMATETNRPNMIKLLTDHKADVNKPLATNGYCALHKASSYNHADAARVLIDKGADINKLSSLGYAPLHMAASAGSEEVADILLESKCSVDIPDKVGITPLMRAIHDKQHNIANRLIDCGADINISSVDGLHALHFAAQVGAENMMEKLISLGASPNVQEIHGATPLHITISCEDIELSELLLSKGASVDVPNLKKVTPLHIAAATNNVEAVELLLKYGANPLLQDGEQRTPFDRTDSKSVQKMLKSKLAQAENPHMKTHKTEATFPTIQTVAKEIAEAGRIDMLRQQLDLPQNEWQNIISNHAGDTERAFAALKLKKDDLDLAILLQNLGLPHLK